MERNSNLNLQKFIISVVLVGIVLVIGIYISDAIGDTVQVENTAASSVNESVTFNVLNTAVDLNAASQDDAACSAVTNLTNATAIGTGLLFANVTLTSDCTLLNASATDTDPAIATVFVSYTYTYSAESEASNAAADVVDALATGTSWISILVVVGFATIILTMLTSGLGAAARREDEVVYY